MLRSFAQFAGPATAAITASALRLGQVRHLPGEAAKLEKTLRHSHTQMQRQIR
jgi:hypothetical protein